MIANFSYQIFEISFFIFNYSNGKIRVFKDIRNELLFSQSRWIFLNFANFYERMKVK